MLHYFWMETSLKVPDEKWREQGIAFLPADSKKKKKLFEHFKSSSLN